MNDSPNRPTPVKTVVKREAVKKEIKGQCDTRDPLPMRETCLSITWGRIMAIDLKEHSP